MSDVENKLYCDAPLDPNPSPEGYCRYPLVRQSKDTARTSLYYGIARDYRNSTACSGFVTDGRKFGRDCNIYLKSVRWAQVCYWNNESDSTQKYSLTTTTGITNTQGSEVTVDAGISAAFKGIGVNIGTSHKTFSSTEVSNSTSVTKEVTVDAKSQTWFYQKEYEFITEKLYIVEDGGGDFVVYIRGKPTAQYSTQVVKADEYTTRKSELTGRGIVRPVTVARAPITRIYDVDVLDRHSRVTFNNFWNQNNNRTPPA